MVNSSVYCMSANPYGLFWVCINLNMNWNEFVCSEDGKVCHWCFNCFKAEKYFWASCSSKVLAPLHCKLFVTFKYFKLPVCGLNTKLWTNRNPAGAVMHRWASKQRSSSLSKLCNLVFTLSQGKMWHWNAILECIGPACLFHAGMAFRE